MNNKKLSIVFTLILSITTLSSYSQSPYKLKVKIEDSKDSIIYLGEYYNGKLMYSDTAYNKGSGNYIFQGKELKGGVYAIVNKDNSDYFEFIFVENNFSITTKTQGGMVNNVKFKGSKENQIFYEFLNYSQQKYKLLMDLNQELKKEKDKKNQKEIQKKIDDINQNISNFRQELIKKNPKLFVSKLFLAMNEPQVPDNIDSNNRFYYYKQHFFDDIDFSDYRMLRTPFFQPKIMKYMEKLTYPMPDSIVVSAIYLIEKAKANKDIFRYMLSTLTFKYERSKIMGMENVFFYLAKKYYLKEKRAYWMDSAKIAKINKKIYDMQENLIGNIAKDFISIDTLGLLSPNPIKEYKSTLSRSNAYITVLYFYDPDCGHCRKVTPHMRRIYNKYKDKSVQVIGICTEFDQDKWKDYIKKNKLNFINVSDVYMIEPNPAKRFRHLYDINSTPIIYLLDKDKKIIAKRLTHEQLDKFIEMELKQKK